MGRIFLIVVLFLNFVFGSQMYQSVDKDSATILQKGAESEYCPDCGMNLVKFFKTNHAAKLKDGTVRQFCSLHCLIEEQRGALKDASLIEQIFVVDSLSLKFIPAHEAYYVVGSDKPATMSMTSEYAFKERSAAEAFAKEYGGEVMEYARAHAMASAEFDQDVAMIKDKRAKNMYPKAEKIYNESCDKARLDKLHLHTISSIKAMLKGSDICGSISDDSALQALAVYLFEKKLLGGMK